MIVLSPSLAVPNLSLPFPPELFDKQLFPPRGVLGTHARLPPIKLAMPSPAPQARPVKAPTTPPPAPTAPLVTIASPTPGRCAAEVSGGETIDPGSTTWTARPVLHHYRVQRDVSPVASWSRDCPPRPAAQSPHCFHSGMRRTCALRTLPGTAGTATLGELLRHVPR